ncbi:hypothetical protein M2262_000989 [Pseudomonas sp. BIGb0408]|uniref:DUF2878 domain-containing protein n=1 Tax=Phytopseudomonas flavescens TaxID=29435 RepID=A0A7Y9XNC9_9GAMM|nr:DUF2878 domain-containing protein [Pseudomonas sp. BIGb0408]MCW2290939.1 hypothetical protein [Pseudomonas sp. BIGb0408]NYH74490.1 hypothetical protein [Pseudomonas flavescens]
MPRNLLNALLFAIGWFACIAGGGLWLWLVAVIMLVHLLHIGSWQREGKLLVSVFLFGSAVDSFLLQFGLFDFGEPRQLIPLWLALTWLLLGSTLCHCLAWTARPWWRASLLGACLAPLHYYAAASLDGVNFPYGSAATLILLALMWAAMLPVLHGFARLHAANNHSA